MLFSNPKLVSNLAMNSSAVAYLDNVVLDLQIFGTLL